MKSSLSPLEVCQRRPSARTSALLLGREERGCIHLECFGQDCQFSVSDAAQLSFNLRERPPTQFQPQHRAACGKKLLRQSLLVTQFSDLRAGNVLRLFMFSSRHAPKMELDGITKGAFNCSDIGAVCCATNGKGSQCDSRQAGVPAGTTASSARQRRCVSRAADGCPSRLVERASGLEMSKYATGQEIKIRGTGRGHQTTDTCETAQAVGRPANHEDKAEIANRLPTKPDVIVATRHQTVLFEPQNQRAFGWLRQRCNLVAENVSGNTEIRVHPRQCHQIIAELKAAGFIVADGRGELC
jgi:hypothetical protein